MKNTSDPQQDTLCLWQRGPFTSLSNAYVFPHILLPSVCPHHFCPRKSFESSVLCEYFLFPESSMFLPSFLCTSNFLFLRAAFSNPRLNSHFMYINSTLCHQSSQLWFHYFNTIIWPLMHLQALKLLDITLLRRHVGIYWIFKPLEKSNFSQTMNNQQVKLVIAFRDPQGPVAKNIKLD